MFIKNILLMLQYLEKFMKKLITKIKNLTVNFSIKKYKKNPVKYIFYTIAIFLPLMSLIFLDLKPFTILLLSYVISLTYLNLCLFDKVCIIKNEGTCKLNINDLYEALIYGVVCLILLLISQNLFRVYYRKN